MCAVNEEKGVEKLAGRKYVQKAVGTSGDVIIATEKAPQQAICRHCGETVYLRYRRSMDGTVSYFWRHRRNSALSCPGRSRPIERRR